MDLENFLPLKNFKLEDFTKETPIVETRTLEDLLKLPVNSDYLENKKKEKLDINSNFKSNHNINATQSSR